MNYEYNIICHIKEPKIYIEEKVLSSSFTSALFFFIEKRKIEKKVFSVYCKKRISGDLQYMGTYDGNTVIHKDGTLFSHILKTSENKEYSLAIDGFKRIFLS